MSRPRDRSFFPEFLVPIKILVKLDPLKNKVKNTTTAAAKIKTFNLNDGNEFIINKCIMSIE
jgi:hypothetical protein